MDQPHGDRSRAYLKCAVILLSIALVVLVVFFAIAIVHLKRLEFIDQQRVEVSDFLRSHGSLTADDVSLITSWMTFDYINRLFKLPEDYLKTSLSVSDSRYPQMSVYAYAKASHTSTATSVAEVSSAVRDYLIKQANPVQ
ncbi:MAG: hypothetical protein M1361_02360 [Patescibacteria group bacterium]|nr:hypothetical protein [Patescibacteria group bacterium]MCL5224422.1 hypothetical protein [Patescibacteria group bacterium]